MLPGQRFLFPHHKGRVTGKWHETVLEVARGNKAERAFVVGAAWGDQADWLKNLRA